MKWAESGVRAYVMNELTRSLLSTLDRHMVASDYADGDDDGNGEPYALNCSAHGERMNENDGRGDGVNDADAGLALETDPEENDGC